MSEILAKIHTTRRKALLTGAVILAGLAAGRSTNASETSVNVEPAAPRPHLLEIQDFIKKLMQLEGTRVENSPRETELNIKLMEEAAKLLNFPQAVSVVYPSEGNIGGVERFLKLDRHKSGFETAVMARIHPKSKSDILTWAWIDKDKKMGGKIVYSDPVDRVYRGTVARAVDDKTVQRWDDGETEYTFYGSQQITSLHLEEMLNSLSNTRPNTSATNTIAVYLKENFGATQIRSTEPYIPPTPYPTTVVPTFTTPAPRPKPYWIPTPTMPPYILPYKDRA